MDHWISTYRVKGIRFVPMPGCGLKINAPWHVLKSYEAYLWLKAEHFDVVHFSEWKGPGYFTLLARHQGLAFANTLLCVHTHGPTLWHKLSNSEYVTGVDDLEIDYLERLSASLADGAVSPRPYLFHRSHAPGRDSLTGGQPAEYRARMSRRGSAVCGQQRRRNPGDDRRVRFGGDLLSFAARGVGRQAPQRLAPRLAAREIRRRCR